MQSMQIIVPEQIPEIVPGDNLASVLSANLMREQIQLQSGDILVLAHKIVSKAEGRLTKLSDIVPSPGALALAKTTGKDPALVELILQESAEILWAAPNGLLIAKHRLGFVCANAAVDCSNAGNGMAIQLPKDPDASAARIRSALEATAGCRLGVIICDTHGKPFRKGACGTVIGASGVRLLNSYVGLPDREGRIMRSSIEAVGDELACAATLMMGQGSEGRPLAIIRGLDFPGNDTAADLLRTPQQDVFLSALQKTNGGRYE